MKERDSYENIDYSEWVTKLPVTFVPLKFITTEQHLNKEGCTKKNKIELVYSVEKKHFSTEQVYLFNEICSLSYLGIVYPNGKVRLCLLRAVNNNEIDKRVVFFCKDISRSEKRQEKVMRLQQRINESLL